MKKIIFLISAVFFSLNSFSQPVIQWQKCLGGSGSDGAYSIVETGDGGYVAAGNSNSPDGDVTGNHGLGDYWIVKLDITGNIQWQKSLGGSNNDLALSIIQTNNGEYIVAGGSYSSDGDIVGSNGFRDYWIVKLDSSGSIQWQKPLGGTGDEEALSIIQTSEGAYLIAGSSNSNDGDVTGNHGGWDYWIVKLDNNGNIQWQKSLGGTGDDLATSIIQTGDGGYVIAGYSNSTNGDVTGNHGAYDYWIVKLDSSGNIGWQKSLGGTVNDYSFSIIQTSDGGYITTGQSQSNNGNVTGNHGYYDYWIVKLDSSGNIQWQKSLGGTGNEYAYSAIQTSDGGYMASGYSDSNDGDVTGNHGNRDYWISKLDTNGNIQWQKSLGGIGSDEEYSIIQTSNGSFVAAGSSYSNDGDVTGNHGLSDFWIVKLSPATGLEDLLVKESFRFFPNPTTSELVVSSSEFGEIITIEIYSSLGEKVFSQPITRNEKQVTISVADFPPGIYFIRVADQAGNKVTKKVVKM